ncbi:hypothetical protein V0R37_12105 [Pollutimonas sp. H1-120]|uniref:hypothetical protein n=1 Tax=Pollutimonas sp. H1-120 TaxID=3148824 RepID=UPI003B5242AB
MAQPSDLESWPVFVLLNGVGFWGVFAVGVGVLFVFRPLSTATVLLYYKLEC